MKFSVEVYAASSSGAPPCQEIRCGQGEEEVEGQIADVASCEKQLWLYPSVSYESRRFVCSVNFQVLLFRSDMVGYSHWPDFDFICSVVQSVALGVFGATTRACQTYLSKRGSQAAHGNCILSVCCHMGLNGVIVILNAGRISPPRCITGITTVLNAARRKLGWENFSIPLQQNTCQVSWLESFLQSLASWYFDTLWLIAIWKLLK